MKYLLTLCVLAFASYVSAQTVTVVNKTPMQSTTTTTVKTFSTVNATPVRTFVQSRPFVAVYRPALLQRFLENRTRLFINPVAK